MSSKISYRLYLFTFSKDQELTGLKPMKRQRNPFGLYINKHWRSWTGNHTITITVIFCQEQSVQFRQLLRFLSSFSDYQQYCTPTSERCCHFKLWTKQQSQLYLHDCVIPKKKKHLWAVSQHSPPQPSGNGIPSPLAWAWLERTFYPFRLCHSESV